MSLPAISKPLIVFITLTSLFIIFHKNIIRLLKPLVLSYIILIISLVFTGCSNSIQSSQPSTNNTVNNAKINTSSSKSEKFSSNTTSLSSNEVSSFNTSNDLNFKKEKEEFSKDVINAIYSKNRIYVKLETKPFSSSYYNATMNESDYIYYGDTKDNIPNGKGILLKSIYENNTKHLFAPIYIGYFKNGLFNGFGFQYKDASQDDIIENFYSSYTENLKYVGVTFKEYEGYFKDGKFSGIGNMSSIYINPDEDIFNGNSNPNNFIEKYLKINEGEIKSLEEKWQENTDTPIISKLPPLDSSIYYIGNFSNEKFNGKGKQYNSNNKLIYDGNFSNSEYSGYGKLYYSSGKLKYEGNFSNGKYNGKGTLYEENGKIKFNGNFKNEEIK